MKFRFFSIPAIAPTIAEDELNRFVGSHRVSSVERQLVPDGASSFWAVCVTWIDGPSTSPSQGTVRRGRVDYREILPPDQFALYDRLRTLRKERAEAEGLPPFAVFTNEQLAEMVRRRVTTPQALAAIDGIGEARLSRYGPAFLEILVVGVPLLDSADASAPDPQPAASTAGSDR